MKMLEKHMIEAASAKEAVMELVSKDMAYYKQSLNDAIQEGSALVRHYEECVNKLNDTINGVVGNATNTLFKATENRVATVEYSYYYVEQIQDTTFLIEVYKRSEPKDVKSWLED